MMNIVIILLGILSAFGPLSIDMYLPALPKIATDFGVELSSVQLSLASFFVGIAAGQVFYGPVTDKWGRKKPLYFGLALYTVASFLCAISTNVESLILYRFVQALGSCAGMVISRAVVRDLYKPHDSAKIFSTLMLIMGVAPILAPVLGGFFVLHFNWRIIFWFLTAVSFTTLLLIFFFLKETHTPNPHYRFKNVFRNYWIILKDKDFTGYTLSMSFIYAGMFAYITGSAFVFIQHYGVSPSTYSIIFGMNAFGLITLSQVNGKLLRKYTPSHLIKVALPCVTLAGVFLLFVGITNGPIWAMCISLFCFILMLGMIAPNASACALANQREFSGSASAMMGSIQFTVSALVSSLVSKFHDGSILPMTAIMFSCGVISLVLYFFLVSENKNLASQSL